MTHCKCTATPGAAVPLTLFCALRCACCPPGSQYIITQGASSYSCLELPASLANDPARNLVDNQPWLNVSVFSNRPQIALTVHLLHVSLPVLPALLVCCAATCSLPAIPASSAKCGTCSSHAIQGNTFSWCVRFNQKGSSSDVTPLRMVLSHSNALKLRLFHHLCSSVGCRPARRLALSCACRMALAPWARHTP